MTLGEIVVLLVLAGIVGLAVRSLWKSRKTNGHCTGNCTICGGCHSNRRIK